MRRLLFGLAVAVAAGCSSPPHENPFDPATPVQQQARATLAGAVSLEPLGSAAPDLAGVRLSIPGAGVVDTDATGHWSLPNVPTGTYVVTASKDGWVPSSVAGVIVTLDDGNSTVQVPPLALAVARGGVAGSVTLAGAPSSSGALVIATGPVTATAVTDATGSFLLSGLPVGAYSITVEREPEWAPSGAVPVTVSLGVVASLPSTPVLQPRATGSIAGTAALEGGGDASGTTAGLTGVDFRGAAVSATTTTAATGAWSFTGLAAGSYRIALSRTGFATPAAIGVSLSTGQAVDAGASTLAFARGAVAGTAVASGAADLSGTVVTVSGGPDTATGVTDATGAFTLTGLRVGTGYTAAFRRTAYATQTSAAFAVAEGLTTAVPAATLSLLRTGSVSGQASVERPAGANGGIAVALSGTDVNGAAVSGGATTASDGSYTLGALPQGTYAVTLAKVGYDPRTISGLFVAAGGAATAAAVTLPVATGTVAGTATLSAGAVAGFQVGTDQSGIVVTLSGVDVPVAAAVTDPSGAYRFTSVPVSTTGAAYTVTAQKPNFQAATASVTAAANATAPVPALSLPVDAGMLSGTVLLRDDVGGAGDNATHGGTAVAVTGTAFNGTSWSAGTTTASNGTFQLATLPPGSYDVVATSASRTCPAFAPATVQPGATTAAGTVRCLDAVGPSAVALGAPVAPPGGQSGYAAGTSVDVPIATPATDATAPASNFRGYQVVVGSAADWSAATLVAGQPGTLTFTGLVANATNTLWARGIDWIGNAGPAATVQVVTDTVPPLAPTISTPRPYVDATTTSVTLSGAEGDATFAGYEICTATQAATLDCAASAPGGCAWSATAAAFALSLTADQRTCLWARAHDRAGNRGPASSLGLGGVVSDLTPPTPPALAPAFDPTLVTIRAPWVDLFVTAASTDAPGGGGPWQHVAWLEVDTGAGFEPLCPAEACRPGGTWTPCGCGCSDARLVCDGARFVGVRAPLLEGTRNTIAVRAVDLAGNVGSGVSQQVVVQSTGAVVAATAAQAEGPNLRGNLLTYSDWSPGAGMPHGIVVDLGPDRRFDGGDTVCDVSAIVASGSARGVFPVSPTLVVDARYSGGAWLHEPGADGIFCTGDDVNAQFRAVEVDPTYGYYYLDGISGAGEVVAWWERLNSPATAKLYVQEAGPDHAFGNGDDVLTQLATFSQMGALTVGTRAILVQHDCPVGACGWRVFNANGSGGYASGVTTWDLAPHDPLSTIAAAGLSSDGRTLAWLDGAGNLVVRSSGADGSFGGPDDVEAWTTLPPAWGLSVSSGNAVAVDATHVVVAASGSPVSYLVHWWAGLDGTFGTPDDTLSRTHPTSGTWGTVSLDAGLAAYAEDGDVKLVDLSTLRWEVAPQGALAGATPELAVDGRGNLFYRPTGSGLVARTPAGLERTGPGAGTYGVLDRDLLVVEGTALVWFGAGPDGTWFGPDAPAPATLYTGAGWALSGLALGGGKALVVDERAGGGRYMILEPGAGTLATFAATGTVLDALGVDQPWDWGYGITATQAFFTCNGIATNLCVRTASGPGGTFDAADPVAYLVHPPGSPRAGNPVIDARALLVNGQRLLFAEFSPPALYLFDAGPDGAFGTADDRGRKLADGYFAQGDIALAGSRAAFLADGAPAGRQVYLVHDFAELPVPASEHYSTKASLALEPGGRVFWVDSVFVPSAVFVRVP